MTNHDPADLRVGDQIILRLPASDGAPASYNGETVRILEIDARWPASGLARVTLPDGTKWWVRPEEYALPAPAGDLEERVTDLEARFDREAGVFLDLAARVAAIEAQAAAAARIDTMARERDALRAELAETREQLARANEAAAEVLRAPTPPVAPKAIAVGSQVRLPGTGFIANVVQIQPPTLTQPAKAVAQVVGSVGCPKAYPINELEVLS